MCGLLLSSESILTLVDTTSDLLTRAGDTGALGASVDTDSKN
jgi:hypothetical protein